jgi:mRNA-degrading endonuclease RelE of RelBE toxin-antitoxin system
MSYNVKTIPRFDREIKRLVKKYASLKNEYEKLIDELEENPEIGTSLENNLYQIRLAITSKGRGKRSGARMITYLKTNEGNIYLLTIYDKGEKDTISNNEMQKILVSEIGI